MKRHLTKTGKSIPLNKLTNAHLLNIIRYLKRKAASGVALMQGCSGPSGDDIYYDEVIVTGPEAEEVLHIPIYEEELKRRQSECLLPYSINMIEETPSGD